MKTGGWIFLIGSWGFILTLVIFSLWKVLTEKEKSSEENRHN